MKQLAIQHINQIPAIPFNGSTEFKLRPVVAMDEAKQCTVHVVEVEPSSQAFGYHYHEINEEVFYIIAGQGMLRTHNGEVAVQAGDIMTFPAGPTGAHAIRNTSATEKLVYLDFDTANPVEIVHFPDTKKIMAIGPFSNGMYDLQ